MGMTVYDFVKHHSGLRGHEAVHNLCVKIETYMIKKQIQGGITPELVKKVQRMTYQTIVDMPDKRGL